MDNRNPSDNKRSVSSFITRLGAHTAHIAVHAFREMGRAGGEALAPAAANLSERKVRRAKANAARKELLAQYRERFSNRRSNLGTLPAVKLFFKDLAGDVRRNTNVPAAVFNAAFPAVCIGVLVLAVQGRTSKEYAVEVEMDGDTIGIVTDENIYGQAKQAVTEKLELDTSENTDYYNSARLSLRTISSSDDIIDENVLAGRIEERIADKLPDVPDEEEADEDITESTASDEAFAELDLPEEEPEDDTEKSPGFVVLADGKTIGVVSSYEEIEAALEEKRAPYLGIDGVDDEDVFFDKDITYEERVYIPPYALQDQQDIIDLLNGKETEAEYYEVEPGDNLWAISAKYGMTVDDLAERPATFNGKNVELGDNIRVGTIIELESDAPFISVEYRHLADYEKIIPYETVTFEDSSLLKGTQKVINEGTEGINKVTALVTYKVVKNEDGTETGKPIRKKIISEEPVSSPSARVVNIGTALPTVTRGTNAGSGDYFWPVDGGYISQGFGGSNHHKGMDIAAPYGTPIYAAADGTVYDVGSGWGGGYGNNVKIQNDDGNVTVYGHMSSTAAEINQHVSAGDVIGYVGSTGDSTGNHLHFEVRYQGSYYDPAEFVSQ